MEEGFVVEDGSGFLFVVHGGRLSGSPHMDGSGVSPCFSPFFSQSHH